MLFPMWQLPNVIFPSGNFPMVFSQGTTSQRYFPKWKLPNVIFPCGNFPSLFSQVANSQRYFPKWKLPNGIFPSDNFPVQFPERQLPKSVLAAALGLLVSSSRSALPLTHPSRSASPPPHCRLRRPRRPNPSLGSCSLGNWNFGNCQLGSRPWENIFLKMLSPNLKFAILLGGVILLIQYFSFKVVYRWQNGFGFYTSSCSGYSGRWLALHR